MHVCLSTSRAVMLCCVRMQTYVPVFQGAMCNFGQQSQRKKTKLSALEGIRFVGLRVHSPDYEGGICQGLLGRIVCESL